MTVVLAGETPIVKSPTDVTTSVTPAVRVTGPLVARIVSGYVPANVVASVVTVIVVVPEPTTDVALNDAFTPDGMPVTLKVTIPEKPDAGVTVAV